MDVNYCPELGAHQHLKKETATYFHQPDLYASDPLCLCNHCTGTTLQLDAFCEPVDDQIYVDDTISGSIFFNEPPPPFSGEVAYHCADEFNLYNHPKRIKTSTNPFSSEYVHGNIELNNGSTVLYNSFIGSGYWPEPEFYQVPANFCGDGHEGTGKANVVEMSAQTVAARQRRKKISDKTQELGKLIPGGRKMNTADMYLAAFKYVKFLEAQIGILKLMAAMKESRKPGEVDSVHALLSSSKVPERLYEQGKCLVPKEFVEVLAKEQHILSSPSVSKELYSLLLR